MYYASICAIAKDEDKNLREWVLYHFAIGFEHIVIYDNNSKNPIKNILSEFISNGLITVFDLDMDNAQQLSAYLHCLNKWGSNSYWIAFIDIDEFIVPINKNDIKDILDDYRDYGGLGITWKIFSSNGHVCRPKGRTIENYFNAIELNSHIKSIVRPKLTVRPLSPHHFLYKNGYYCVNEDYIPIKNFSSYPLSEKICINHYYYKSQQDFEEKINRGRATQAKISANINMDMFYRHLSRKCTEDKTIFKFLKILNTYEKYPIDILHDIVKGNIIYNINTGIEKIIAECKSDNIIAAKKLYSRLSRYSDTFELHIIGIELALLARDKEKALKLLQKEMSRHDISCEELEFCYKALSRYYTLKKKNMISESILKMID